MPTLAPPSTILVTGSNGYLASWVLHFLLEAGYTVRAAVRSLSKATPLKEHFAGYVEQGKLHFVVVEDVLKDGAYDEVIKDVDGVIHLASPAAAQVTDPQEIIAPAVQGTLTLLRAATLTPRIKRIVMISSVLSIIQYNHPDPAKVFSEADWSDAPAIVDAAGANAPPVTVYSASKVLAEKAAWDFFESKGREDGLGWDLVVLNPPYMFGPPLLNAHTPSTWPTTQQMWYNNVLKPSKTESQLAQSGLWIDVRDIAEIHVLALQNERATNKRVFVSEGSYIWQEWVDIVSKLAKGTALEVEEGFPDLVKEKKYAITFDKRRGEEVFGFKYRTKEETAKDIIAGLTGKA